MLFRSNLDSGLKRKLCVYILFGFLQKGDVWGKNVCSPRPAPTIQSSLLHSTKPKESFKRKDMDAWGWGQTLFHRYRQVVANQKVVSNSQGNTKRTENQPSHPKKKPKPLQNEMGFYLSCTQAKISNQKVEGVCVGGRATVNNHIL